MFQYVWIILLAILYIAWIVKTIIDTVRHYKYDNDYFFPDLYGGWSVVFIFVHVIVILYLSVNYYYLYH